MSDDEPLRNLAAEATPLERERARLMAERERQWQERKPEAERWLGDHPWEVVLGNEGILTIDCREVVTMRHRARTRLKSRAGFAEIGDLAVKAFRQHVERPTSEGLYLLFRNGDEITLNRDEGEGVEPRALMAEIHRRGRLGLGLDLPPTAEPLALPSPEPEDEP